MKSIKVIVIGFILAIALVVWPVEYTRNITAGTGFLLVGVLAACRSGIQFRNNLLRDRAE